MSLVEHDCYTLYFVYWLNRFGKDLQLGSDAYYFVISGTKGKAMILNPFCKESNLVHLLVMKRRQRLGQGSKVTCLYFAIECILQWALILYYMYFNQANNNVTEVKSTNVQHKLIGVTKAG